MTTRVMSGIVFMVLGVLMLCTVLVAVLWSGGLAAAGCESGTGDAGPRPSPASSTTDAAAGPTGRWDAGQTANAATIITAGEDLQVPRRGWVIAVATAMQESSLINTPGGDRDSIGLFQQRPSQGWGNRQQLADPRYAATAFYRRLQSVDGWPAMPLTAAAQKVQHSAYPSAYAKWEPDATRLVTAITGTAGHSGCGPAVSAQGWTAPVDARPGSGFRTADRPGHDGVDLITARGTPIRAAATGTVNRVRCNAIDARTGSDWGCDRDGDPQLTRGCGWYVDITHAGGIITRYCHQLTRPTVRLGQHVAAGEVIGVTGSSGHSSGPHLHFEIHLGDHTAATAIDPVAFMASAGAPLDGRRRPMTTPIPPQPSPATGGHGRQKHGGQ